MKPEIKCPVLPGVYTFTQDLNPDYGQHYKDVPIMMKNFRSNIVISGMNAFTVVNGKRVDILNSWTKSKVSFKS